MTDLTDHYESTPGDRSTVPYVDGCPACAELKSADTDAHPFPWLNKAATHFASDHGVKLFISRT